MAISNKTTDAGALPGVSVQFAAVGVAGAALACGLTWGMAVDRGATVVGLTLYAVSMAVGLVSLARSYPHRVIGLCNVATTFRLALVAVLMAAVAAPDPADWAVFCVAVAAFALDGLDGWLARRERLASAFGARFDMEVDSLLALVLAVLAWQSGSVGVFVIMLGLPRYAFWVAQIPFPWLNGDLPERFSRKIVCVVQIAALIVAVFPAVPAPVAGLCVGLSALALVWSFWLDVRVLRGGRA